MKSSFIILTLGCFIWILNSCETAKTDAGVANNAKPSKDSLIKRGHYLVSIIGCNDCHSPKKMGPQGPFVDTALALSGFPAGRPAPAGPPQQPKNRIGVFFPRLTRAC